MEHDVIIAGFGGQGILLMGNLLAEAALIEGRRVTYMPSYGVEMRGGTAHCTVVVSDEAIGSPVLSTTQALISMSAQARQKFEPRVLPDGFEVLNTSLVSEKDVEKKDIEVLAFPFNQIAQDLGNARLANMVALGVYLGRSNAVKLEYFAEGFEHLLSEGNRKFIPQNIEAINHGMSLVNGASK